MKYLGEVLGITQLDETNFCGLFLFFVVFCCFLLFFVVLSLMHPPSPPISSHSLLTFIFLCFLFFFVVIVFVLFCYLYLAWSGSNAWAFVFNQTSIGIDRSISDCEREFLLVFFSFFFLSFFFLFQSSLHLFLILPEQKKKNSLVPLVPGSFFLS